MSPGETDQKRDRDSHPVTIVTTLSDFFWADNIWADIIMGGDITMGAEKGIETSSNKQQILINN